MKHIAAEAVGSLPDPNAMRRPRLGLLILMIVLGCMLCGCVTSKRFRLAKPGTPPAQPLNLSVPEPPLEVRLGTVIVFKGPGSWKQEARWDEYVVAFVNRSAEPLIVDSVQLVDVQGLPRTPGDDPWKLEDLSRSNWDKYGKAGLAVVATAGATALYTAAVEAVAVSELSGMFTGASATGAAAVAPFVLVVIPVVAVADVSAVAVMNHHNKEQVRSEFERRRLVLPQPIAPGASAAGSLFFPMTPGPQRLVVDGHAGNQEVHVVLDLAPLAGLHLRDLRAAK
jgi:hypothetical protein